MGFCWGQGPWPVLCSHLPDLNHVFSPTSSGSTSRAPLVPTVLAVHLLLPPVTINPQRPSPSSHWLASTMVMPRDWACPACALHQSGSLYLRDESLWGYLNPTADSKDCSDVCFTAQKKKKASGGGLWVDKRVNPGWSDWCLKMLPLCGWVKDPQSEAWCEWMKFCVTLLLKPEFVDGYRPNFAVQFAVSRRLNVAVASSQRMERMQQPSVPSPRWSREAGASAEPPAERRRRSKGRRREEGGQRAKSGASDHGVSPRPFCLSLFLTRHAF